MGERQDDPPSAPAGWLSRIAAYAFALFVNALFLILAIVGPLVVNAMIREWRAGEIETAMAIVFGVFGVILTAIGFGFFWFAYVGAPRFLGGLERTREKYKDRPWLADRQWRARRVVHSTKYTAWFMWFWCTAWWGILGVLWSVNKELILADLRADWGTAIPTALPFLAGLIGLVIAIGLTWRRWRYGDAVLLIDTLPRYLGEDFRGRVMAGLKGKPFHPVGVVLTCGSMRSEQRRTGDGEYETVWITDELWSSEKSLHPTQTTFDRGRVTLPIDFDLPADLPESGHVLDEPQIVWKLKIVPRPGRDQPLRSEFQIPVFERRAREPSLEPERSGR